MDARCSSHKEKVRTYLDKSDGEVRYGLHAQIIDVLPASGRVLSRMRTRVKPSKQSVPATVVDERLLRAFGDPLPRIEADRWAAMSPKQREKALLRLDVLLRWPGRRGSWSAADAAEEAKMSTSRFYRMAATWADEEVRSLSVLGAFAANPTRRRSRFDEELLEDLRKRAADLVEGLPNKPRPSTEKLIDELLKAIDPAGLKMPGRATLRAIVDEARRAATVQLKVGEDLQFDCCACSIRQADGRPFILYPCIDAATGLILGFAFGSVDRSVEGHRAAAADVIERMPSWLAANLPWATLAERAELVIGSDLQAFRSWETEVRARAGRVNVQGSNKNRRYGRYLKEHVGTSVGRILLLPPYTDDERKLAVSTTRESFSEQEARVRFELEMSAYNEDLLYQVAVAIPRDQPDRLWPMLEAIAA